MVASNSLRLLYLPGSCVTIATWSHCEPVASLTACVAAAGLLIRMMSPAESRMGMERMGLPQCERKPDFMPYDLKIIRCRFPTDSSEEEEERLLLRLLRLLLLGRSLLLGRLL